MTDDVVYLVTPSDDLVMVDGGWDEFARRQGATDLVGQNVLGRCLWDYVTDRHTRTLYRDLLARVRAGNVVEFPLRCDGPDCRRLMNIRVSPRPHDLVEFRVRVESEEAREPVALLDPAVARDGEMVRVCGWCKKVDVDGQWVEVESAVEQLRLFARPVVPPLTHGICPPCLERMEALLKES